MTEPTDGDWYVKYSAKELMAQLHQKVDDGFDRVSGRIDRVEVRIDSLESDRDKGFFPRKWGGIAVTALLTTGIGAIVGMVAVR